MGELADYIRRMTPCQGQRKDGQPCQRWVFPPFVYCHWHRPKPAADELAQRARERDERLRRRLLAQLARAETMLADAQQASYPDERARARTLAIRRRWLRKFRRELAHVGWALCCGIPV